MGISASGKEGESKILDELSEVTSYHRKAVIRLMRKRPTSILGFTFPIISRFLICGVDIERIRRIIPRVKSFYEWDLEWSKEGEVLENLAGDDFTTNVDFQYSNNKMGCYSSLLLILLFSP